MFKLKLLLALLVVLALVNLGEAHKKSKEKHSHSHNHSHNHSKSKSSSGSSSESNENGRCQTKEGVIRGKVLRTFKTDFLSVCCDSCYQNIKCTHFNYNKRTQICRLRYNNSFVLQKSKNGKY